MCGLAWTIRQGWRAWRNPLNGHRIRLRTQNPAVSGHHGRRRTRYTPLPSLSPVAGKPIIARFDGGSLTSDGGRLALREVEERLGVARPLVERFETVDAAG
jgi:hypothetical protein